MIPATCTVGWVVFVLASGHVGRVSDQWRAALTMVFGSFVAGFTPQGGGAVAFPVFSKIIEIPPEIARTFSLSIQATGMVMASVIILLAGRRADAFVLKVGLVGGSFGLFVFSAIGGAASALTGSGVDVFLFLFVTLVAALHPRVGIPTSIIAMAFVSVLGFVVFGLIDG